MLEDLLDALFHAFWVEKRGVQLPEVFESIVRTVLEKSLASEVIKLVSFSAAVNSSKRVRS